MPDATTTVPRQLVPAPAPRRRRVSARLCGTRRERRHRRLDRPRALELAMGGRAAQVLAGLVTYPPDSPIAIAQARLWSLVPQCGALLLSLGMSEAVLSQILSGLLGLVSSRRSHSCATRSDGMPRWRSVRRWSSSSAKPRTTASCIPSPCFESHTYGVIGLSLAVLCFALLGVGWYSTGAFLLAMTPAVQVTLGAWTIAIVAVAVLFDRNFLPSCGRVQRDADGRSADARELRHPWRLARPVPAIDAENASRFFELS